MIIEMWDVNAVCAISVFLDLHDWRASVYVWPGKYIQVDDNTFIYCRFLNLHEFGTSDICGRDFANVMFCSYVHLYTITIFWELKDLSETRENKRLTKMKECTVRAEIQHWGSYMVFAAMILLSELDLFHDSLHFNIVVNIGRQSNVFI